jgi:hypothetical protein
MQRHPNTRVRSRAAHIADQIGDLINDMYGDSILFSDSAFESPNEEHTLLAARSLLNDLAGD